VAIDSATSLAKLNLIAPVLTASGCAAAGKELDQFFDITKIGGIVTKSIMLEARSGRPTPRMAETPSGMLNSIGLQGPGIDSFIEKDLAWLHERGVTTIVSIAGNNIEEFGRLASKLRDHPAVAAIEINISCPNVANRGLVFACNTESAADVVSVVRRNVSPGMPLLAKLSPDVTYSDSETIDISDVLTKTPLINKELVQL
jgi:dihydroorotate dehydrogenase (NAD+) catalytic subunit